MEDVRSLSVCSELWSGAELRAGFAGAHLELERLFPADVYRYYSR